MAGRYGAARTGLARFWRVVAELLGVALLGGVLTAAAAPPPAADGQVLVTLERAEESEAADNPNVVLVDAILRDAAGNVPEGTYRVFSSVAPYLPAEGVDDTPSDPEPCRQPRFSTNPEIDEGVFRCAYVVGFPDTWTFDIKVNKVVDGALVPVAQAQATFPVSDAVALEGLAANLRYAVHGNFFKVVLLQAHVAASGVWLFLVAVMACLAVPRLRRALSALTLYRLDLLRDSFVRLLWGTFVAVLSSGLFLVGNQAAYGAPWSKSAWDEVTKLPYATAYFTALYLKIGIFLVMAAASVVLTMESARQGRIAVGADAFDTSDDEFWRRLQFHDVMRDTGAPVAQRRADLGGTVTVAPTARAKPKILTQGAGPRLTWWCVFAVAAGLGAIGVCVTVLKYTHELIEMILAAKAVAEAK